VAHNSVGSDHFFAHPAAVAFGTSEYAASAQDTDEVTQMSTPEDFMGPTLWSTDLDLFDAGWASHMDMLHNSPSSSGIAWEKDNIFWVFDGYHESLTRYNFNEDHGPGGEDHSDGEVWRYAEGEVSYVDGVASHLVFDPNTEFLWVADTGNNRIAFLDTNSGTEGGNVRPNYDYIRQKRVNDAFLITLVDGAVHDMQQPSGIELHDDMLFVSDHGTGFIYAFTLQGELVDWLDTGLGSGALSGMSFHPDGSLYVTNSKANEVIRIAAK
jgi:sugar lactone lactonase YvrE